MFMFHEGLYTDVRIEEVFETKIVFTQGSLDESKIRKYKAGFVRVYDGNRWYYASTSDFTNIQIEIDKLSAMAKPNTNINKDKIVDKFEINLGKYLCFEETSVTNVTKEEKIIFLRTFFPILEARATIKMWKIIYVDSKRNFEFYSSKGTNLIYDTQRQVLEFIKMDILALQELLENMMRKSLKRKPF
jgi:TldD protein